MTFRASSRWLGALAFCWLACTGMASAHWLVYELRFTPGEGSMNFSFYTGAYVIVPASGGLSSIVLTTEEGGAHYAVSENGARFFVAASGTDTKAVISAVASNGSAQAFYLADGFLNHTLSMAGLSGDMRSWRVAADLEGSLLASDDEAGLGPAPDGSLGMVGRAAITGRIREDLSANATAGCDSMLSVVDYVVALLERYGYTPDTATVATEASEAQGEAEMQVIEVGDNLDSVIEPSLFPVESYPPNDG